MRARVFVCVWGGWGWGGGGGTYGTNAGTGGGRWWRSSEALRAASYTALALDMSSSTLMDPDRRELGGTASWRDADDNGEEGWSCV
jgi:hypothetical protein